MKLITARLFKILCLPVFFCCLNGCSPEAEIGSWKNETIKASKRDDFHKLNDQLFAALRANDVNTVSNLMSKELLDQGSINRIVEQISLRSKAGSYNLLDEYYSSSAKEPGPMVINTDATGPDAYTIKYNQSSTKENYVALLVPKSGANKWLVTVIYGKYDYGWKVNKLNIGQYAVNGKTAPQLYQQAKEKLQKGYMLDAVNDMYAAHQSFQPNTQWQYGSENAMNKFYYQLVMAVNAKYAFPYTIKQVTTQPKIFRITTQSLEEGTFPVISYVSSIPLKDTSALKKENTSIKKVIGKVLPGIDKDKKYVLYAVFNGLPGGKKSNEEYDITDKLR